MHHGLSKKKEKQTRGLSSLEKGRIIIERGGGGGSFEWWEGLNRGFKVI